MPTRTVPPNLVLVLQGFEQIFRNIGQPLWTPENVVRLLRAITRTFARAYADDICSGDSEICQPRELVTCPELGTDNLALCTLCGRVAPRDTHRRALNVCIRSLRTVYSRPWRRDPTLEIELDTDLAQAPEDVAQRLRVIVRVPEPRRQDRALAEVHISHSFSITALERHLERRGIWDEDIRRLVSLLRRHGVEVLLLMSGVWVQVVLTTLPRSLERHPSFDQVSAEFWLADILARNVNKPVAEFLILFEEALSDQYFEAIARRTATIVGIYHVKVWLREVLKLVRDRLYLTMPHYAY